MAELGLEDVLDAVVPDWDVRPFANPPGNILAHKLRYVMEDSRSIFGKSIYSSDQARANRWTSIVKTDFVDFRHQPRAATAPDVVRKDKEIMTPRRSVCRAFSSQMFMSWKVPDRVTTGEGSRHSARAPPSARKEDNRKDIQKSSRHDKTDTMLPQIGSTSPRAGHQRSTSAVPATPRIASGMAKLTLSNDLAKQDTNQQMSPVHRSGYPRMPKSFKVSELLNRYYLPCDSAEEWLQRASPSDIKTLERALASLEKSKQTQASWNNNQLDSWLTKATPAEKAVALDFFQSAGTPPGGDPADRSQQIREITEHLKNRATLNPGLLTNPAPDKGSRFKYIRLLTPGKRERKWMYQTWHHLPNYSDTNPVNNRSAMYTEPHKITPRHYVIHPDWG